jgi:primosomal protein N'
VLEAIGAGTERVAERFAELFPGVTFAVLDRDTARRQGAGAVLEEVI